MFKGCNQIAARFRHYLDIGRENVRKAYQWADAAGKTLPTPVRWLLIAFVVLFVVGPITSALCWIMWRVR